MIKLSLQGIPALVLVSNCGVQISRVCNYLGLILGPICEIRVRQTINTAGGDAMVFLERPISAELLTVIVILVSTSVTGGSVVINSHKVGGRRTVENREGV